MFPGIKGNHVIFWAFEDDLGGRDGSENYCGFFWHKPIPFVFKCLCDFSLFIISISFWQTDQQTKLPRKANTEAPTRRLKSLWGIGFQWILPFLHFFLFLFSLFLLLIIIILILLLLFLPFFLLIPFLFLLPLLLLHLKEAPKVKLPSSLSPSPSSSPSFSHSSSSSSSCPPPLPLT